MATKCSIAIHNLKMARAMANSGKATHVQLKEIFLNLYSVLMDVCNLKWPEGVPSNLRQLWVQGYNYLQRGTSGYARVRELIKVLEKSMLDEQSVVIDVVIRKVWGQLQKKEWVD